MNLRRLSREGTSWSHLKVPVRGVDTSTIARMPALIASGSCGHAFTTSARSGDSEVRNDKQDDKQTYGSSEALDIIGWSVGTERS